MNEYRIVIEDGSRHVFTGYRNPPDMDEVRRMVDRCTRPIRLDAPGTTVELDWRPMGCGAPWNFHSRLQGVEKMCPPGTPVTDEAGNKIGECENPRIVDGNLVVDMQIEKDKMPELKQGSLDLDWLLSAPFPTTGTYIPSWNDPPKAPNPLPGTKRYVALLRGEMVAETDDQAEALAVVTSGQADMLCDRQMVGRVNKYCKMTPVKADWTEPANPNPVVSKSIFDAVNAIRTATEIMNEIGKGSEPPVLDGPARFLRLLIKDARCSQKHREEFLLNVNRLADAIEDGKYCFDPTFDPFVLSLIRAGIVAKMKELNW